MSKSIAVFGGNGFLGRKICEVGVKLGWNVTSFLRSGAAPISAAWALKVNWEAANILEPKTYQDKLPQYDAVVHSIGIMFENQSYKKSINSNFSALNDFQSLMNNLKGSNPMEKNPLQTYESVQRDSAVMLAEAFIDAKKSDVESKEPEVKPSYVYVSADRLYPGIPSGYLTTKREAEFELSCKKDLRAVLLRPGIMFEDHQGPNTPRDVITGLLKLGYNAKKLTIGNSLPILNDLVRPPVSTEKVALKLYEKLGDPYFNGVVSLDEINSSRVF